MSYEYEYMRSAKCREFSNKLLIYLIVIIYTININITLLPRITKLLTNIYITKKIMNTIQIMLRNIHPNPDKRMTPQETKTFFVSIFYEC